MIISLIAAISVNYVIGIKNNIPWCLPADMNWFKNNTLNKPVIMGRKTFESIGKPLPMRHNIVLSSCYNSNSKFDVTWVSTPEQALAITNTLEEVMIIGGSKVYETFLPKANKMYLTHINLKVDGDTWFPKYKLNEWKSTFNRFYSANQKISYSYYFEILERC